MAVAKCQLNRCNDLIQQPTDSAYLTVAATESERSVAVEATAAIKVKECRCTFSRLAVRQQAAPVSH